LENRDKLTEYSTIAIEYTQLFFVEVRTYADILFAELEIIII
jgi:hypothetical protein